jgi:AhpC/TSA antioxidant enzyme
VSRRKEDIGARIACVSFAAPQMLAAYERELGLRDVAFLCDPDRALYEAFGFERGSVARVWLDPRVWWRYASLLARGRRWAGLGDDTLQLGGDVLLDPSGSVRWIRRSRGPEDRPRVEEIVTAAR